MEATAVGENKRRILELLYLMVLLQLLPLGDDDGRSHKEA